MIPGIQFKITFALTFPRRFSHGHYLSELSICQQLGALGWLSRWEADQQLHRLVQRWQICQRSPKQGLEPEGRMMCPACVLSCPHTYLVVWDCISQIYHSGSWMFKEIVTMENRQSWKSMVPCNTVFFSPSHTEILKRFQFENFLLKSNSENWKIPSTTLMVFNN